jgi:uncharacterized protein
MTDELGIPDPPFKALKEVNVQIRLDKTQVGIGADFEAQFIVVLSCVRCLDDITAVFHEAIRLDYIAGKDPTLKIEKVALDPRDIDQVYFSGYDIDLSVGIREMIIMAVPIAPACKPDCAGLCPICGRNLNQGACGCQLVRHELFKPRTELRRRPAKSKKK